MRSGEASSGTAFQTDLLTLRTAIRMVLDIERIYCDYLGRSCNQNQIPQPTQSTYETALGIIQLDKHGLYGNTRRGDVEVLKTTLQKLRRRWNLAGNNRPR